MTADLIFWFTLSVICDVAGQIGFKKGADALPDARGPQLALAMFSSPWIGMGLVAYVIELVVWFRILAEVPLSIAFPIASSNFLGVTLASSLILKEKVSRRQWIGASLITCGVILVAQTA